MDVIEMPACECEGETEHEAVPTFTATWPDGTGQELPMTCYENDFSPREIQSALTEIASIGYWSEGGIPTAYIEAVLARVEGDVYLFTQGDVDAQNSSYFYRGTPSEVINEWLGSSDTSHVPVGEVALAQHYGLLDGIPTYDGAYPMEAFAIAPDSWMGSGRFITVSLDIPDDVKAELVEQWEAAGITWPREAATGSGPVFDAWRERIEAWIGEAPEEGSSGDYEIERDSTTKSSADRVRQEPTTQVSRS